MNKYIKATLGAIFFTSKMIFFVYSWAILSVLALYESIFVGQVIFYSGLIYGILWLFEKKFASKQEGVKE